VFLVRLTDRSRWSLTVVDSGVCDVERETTDG